MAKEVFRCASYAVKQRKKRAGDRWVQRPSDFPELSTLQEQNSEQWKERNKERETGGEVANTTGGVSGGIRRTLRRGGGGEESTCNKLRLFRGKRKTDDG